MHASDRFCLELAINPVNHVTRFVILHTVILCFIRFNVQSENVFNKIELFFTFCYMEKICKLRKLVPFFFFFLRVFQSLF